MTKTILIFLTVLLWQAAGSGTVQSQESSYSKLDFEEDCIFEKPESEEEAGMGASGVCRIGSRPPIYFTDGDLRHSAGFGAPKQFQSFAQFNSMNTTIEWRSNGGKPYAAIVRFFIENTNPDTGIPDKANEGQVLVVHSVARDVDDQTCIVGMVDARANKNANVMAREIADNLAVSFDCKYDSPQFHGQKGRFSGTPAF